MKRFLQGLVLLLLLCVVAPAVTVNFSSPPFTTDFIVNQPGNSIAIRFPGVTNVQYIPGTFGYVSNQQVYLGTNNFAGGGGGGSNPNALTNFDQRAWTNLNTGVSSYSGGLMVLKALSVGTVPDIELFPDGSAIFANNNATISAGGAVAAVSFAGDGSLLTGLNANNLATGTVPTARLGSGVANATTFLRGDGSWVGVVTNVVYTNAGPDTLMRGNICFLNTNGLGGGGGSGINQLTGDVTAGPGSGSQVATLKNTGTAGTYRSVTFDAQGRETAGTLPTTFAGYAISDTWPNLAAALTLLIPQSALGTGSAGAGAKFLADDQTYKTVTGGAGITSLQPTNAVLPSVSTNGTIGYIPNQVYTAGVLYPGYFRQYVNGSGLAGLRSIGLGFADLNNDGALDIVATRGSISTFQVLTNTGGGASGLFGNDQAFNTPTGKGTQGHPGLADVNGDGSIDIIFAQDTTGGSNTVFVMTNNGTASGFVQLGVDYTIGSGGSEFALDIATGQLNGDTNVDFAFYGSAVVGVYTNDKAGNFALSWTNTIASANSTHAQDIAIADFNHDGSNDLVFLDRVGGVESVVAFTNQGVLGQFGIYYSNNIVPSSDSVAVLTVGDVNGDGRPDYVVATGGSASHTVYVFTNSGTGFAACSTNVMPLADGIVSLSLADVNMDGSLDMAVAQDSIFATVTLTNDGRGTFSIFETNTVGNTQASYLADVTGDSRPDLITSQGANPANSYQNMCRIHGIFAGDNGANSNLVTITTGNSFTYTAGTFGLGGVVVPATFQGDTNFAPYIAAFVAPVVNGNGGTLTNISFCTTSAASSGTVTSGNTHQIETTYLNSGSTIGSLTWALPTTTTLGKIFYLHSKSAITTLTITGTSFIDTPVTVMSAGQTIGFETIDGGGNYIRLQ